MKNKNISVTFDYTILNPLINKAIRKGKTFEEQVRNVRNVYRKYMTDNDAGDLSGLMWFLGYTSAIRTKIFSDWDIQPISMRKLKQLAKHEQVSHKKSKKTL